MTNPAAGISKYQWATIIAVFFHAVGFIGILFSKNDFFIKATPYNLLLSFALLIWTQQKSLSFYAFAALCLATGFIAEVIGVNTYMLFGKYSYGNSLGIKLAGVPLIIGINWFIIIYCCGVLIHTILHRISIKLAEQAGKHPKSIKALSVIIDGATLAVLFDWIMEPVAIKLGFWKWENEKIPFFNYISWLAISMLLLAAFYKMNFYKHNKFAVHLLMIQVMFFLLLRTFL